MKRSAVLFVLLAACSSGGTTDPPQDQFGTARGQVLTVDDDPVPGVSISLTRAGSASRTATTSAAGAWQVANLAVGAWTVTATEPTGFDPEGSLSATAQVAANQTVDVPAFRLRAEQVTPPPNQVSVSMANTAFSPSAVAVAVGGTVTWTNNDQVLHNVTGADFASSNLSNGQQFARTFPNAGTFNYSCTLHAGMNGTVTVQ